MITYFLFIIADLIMLFNVISVISHNLSFITSKKCIIPFLLHIAFAVFFSLHFQNMNQNIQFIFLMLYFLRFLVIPFTLYKKVTFNLIYFPILIISLDSLVQSCVFWISMQITENANESVITKSSSLVFQAVLFLLILYMHSRQNQFTQSVYFGLKLVPKFVSILILLCIFIMEGIISLITYNTNSFVLQQDITVLFLIILVAILFVIMAVFLINSVARKYFEDTSALMVKQVESQIAHYEALDKMKKEYHSFRHDYINHMKCICSLIKSNKTAEAEEYITDLSKTEILTNATYETGNHILDAIISDKIAVADKLGIKIKPTGVFTTKINPIDICIIFSNLLDNAIEACSKLPDYCSIIMDLKIQQGYQFISIRNPYSNNKTNSQLITTKTNKERHGFGLKNVENTVNKYGGTFIIKQDNGIFSVEITLKL